MSPERTSVYLHIGQGKTGSSYIQSSLAISAAELAAHGYCYPSAGRERERALAGHVNVGNFPTTKGEGFHIPGSYAAMMAKVDWEGRNKLLLSNEGMFASMINHGLLPEVAEASAGHEVHMLMLIRDPLDHALSAYQQGVKGGLTKPLAEFLNNYGLPKTTRLFLQAVAELPFKITVRNYSRHGGDIRSLVEDWLGLPAGTLQAPPHAKVNRSLTRTEMQLQVAFSKYVGRRARLFVSDALSNELPDILAEKPYVDPKTLASFLERMRLMVKPVNARIPREEHYRVPSLAEAVAGLPDKRDADRLQISAEQIEVLARNMAKWFKPEYKQAAKKN